MRRDVRGVLQRMAWAGQDGFPFGMFDCPGWLPAIRRLSDAFASARRHSHLTGVLPTLLNVRPFTGDGEYAAIRYQLTLLNLAPAARLESLRLEKLVGKARRICLTTCQVCGNPAQPLIAGGLWCPRHAPRHFSFEVVANARRLRRTRRRWLNLCRGRMTKYIECYSGVFLPLYAVNGAHFVCMSDAPPGYRQQMFEHLVDLGHHPVNLEGEWLIRSFKRRNAYDKRAR